MRIFLTAVVASFFLVLFTGPLQVYGQEGRVEKKIENKVERVEAIKEKIASREAQLKEKLTKIKDKKKVAAIERSSTYLKRINDQKTQQVEKHLDRMSDVLARLKRRVEEKGAGKDITAAQTAISEAETKIASTKEANSAQSAKIYTPTVTDEAKVKDEIKTLQQTLRTDLQALNKLVIEAKQSVANAIEVSAKTFGRQNAN